MSLYNGDDLTKSEDFLPTAVEPTTPPIPDTDIEGWAYYKYHWGPDELQYTKSPIQLPPGSVVATLHEDTFRDKVENAWDFIDYQIARPYGWFIVNAVIWSALYWVLRPLWL
jgi:hypothetical protein